MEFDPNFEAKPVHLSGNFAEYPSIKSRIPMAKENTTFMHTNNFNHSQYHSLNTLNHNHHSGFLTKAYFLTTPILGHLASDKSNYLNQSLNQGFVNGYHPMPFAPNNNKVESTYDQTNTITNRDVWDFSQRISFHSNVGATSQSQKKSNGEFQDKHKNIIKGHWSANEDMALVQLVEHFGNKKWSEIAKILKGRDGKQCRERWNNHLRPNIKKDSWSEEEDKTLIEAHKEVGNKWAEIARRMPNRTENAIKNRWNATKRRLNAKKRMNKQFMSMEEISLLEKYIHQVIEAEKNLKFFMSKMNIKSENNLFHVQYTSSESDFGSKEYNVMWPGQHNMPQGGSCVPMIVSSKEMENGSTVEDNKMNYENTMEMVPKVQMGKEMDLMEMISRFSL